MDLIFLAVRSDTGPYGAVGEGSKGAVGGRGAVEPWTYGNLIGCVQNMSHLGTVEPFHIKRQGADTPLSIPRAVKDDP